MNQMKVSIKSSIQCLVGIAALSISAIAQAQIAYPLITVDENGFGSVDFTAGPYTGTGMFPIFGFLAPDPGPGGASVALSYDLGNPPALVAGDVSLQDGVNGPIGDIIRFNPQGTGGINGYPAALVFYSAADDGADTFADIGGFPTNKYTNVRVIQETGNAFHNGAYYTPGPTDPGYVTGFTVSYHFISDAVPEPGAIALVIGLGGSCSLMLARRRNKVTQAN